MKIIFEYEKSPDVVITGLKLYKIDERTTENAVIDRHLSDPEVIKIYIIADDNRLE